MAQIFPRRSNTTARVTILAVLLGVVVFGWGLYAVYWSPFTTEVGIPLDQPAPFSHDHHFAGLGIHCLYCHTSVEKSSFAGIPPTETCMTCHSQIWTEAPVLAPVRQSLATRTPLQWNRISDLPDFVYFNHSIHVQKGFGCATCHGRVDRMPLMWKAHTFYMKWCLDCHRDPAQFIRPREEIYNMAWNPPNQRELGRQLVRQYNLRGDSLTDCSICHR